MQATRICAVADCDKPVEHRDWCDNHYRRWLGHGGPLGGRRTPSPSPCSVEGCERRAKARGWCKLHYYRWKRSGEVGSPAVELASTKLPGPQSLFWRGDNIGYHTAHRRVDRVKGPAASHACVDCSGPAAQWSYDHCDPDELVGSGRDRYAYSLKPEHYLARCAACHFAFDEAHRQASR